MEIFIVILLIIIIWVLLNKNNKEKPKQNIIENKNENINEETIINNENAFNEYLKQTYLPNSISGKHIYIYKNLMKIWYDKIISKNRYNSEIALKVNKDWIDYMEALEESYTYHFLSLEENDDEKVEKFDKQHILFAKKAISIEDAFAANIGEEAINQLKTIRDTSYSKFNKNGEIAPKGYTTDINDEFIKEK